MQVSWVADNTVPGHNMLAAAVIYGKVFMYTRSDVMASQVQGKPCCALHADSLCNPTLSTLPC